VNEPLRVVMMGTGEFAVPIVAALLESPHQVLELVTQPPRPQGRRGRVVPSPAAQLAQQHHLPVYTPESINSPEAVAHLRQLAPDVLVVADYGQILSPEVLATARLGGVNLHGSLLPKYRGAAPVQWAIYHGETETGVSAIHMTPRLDAGPVLAQRRTPIGPEETAPELEARLARLAAEMVVPVIQQLAAGTAPRVPQDPALVTRAPRLKKTDGLVRWERRAGEIKNQVRAMQPWPRAYTWWLRGQGEPLRLILHRVDVAAAEAPGEKNTAESEASPGTVLAAQGDLLLVATGGPEPLRVLQLQPSGKRAMDAAEFLRGYPLRAGQRLGTPPHSP